MDRDRESGTYTEGQRETLLPFCPQPSIELSLSLVRTLSPPLYSTLSLHIYFTNPLCPTLLRQPSLSNPLFTYPVPTLSLHPLSLSSPRSLCVYLSNHPSPGICRPVFSMYLKEGGGLRREEGGMMLSGSLPQFILKS